jgi:hypothetical protein
MYYFLFGHFALQLSDHFSMCFSLASAGHGSFAWFCIRMDFEPVLVPKYCGRVPAVDFYCQMPFESDAFVAVFAEGTLIQVFMLF